MQGEKLNEIFKEQWEDVPNVFTSDMGGVVSLNAITSGWVRFIKKCGLKKVKIHGLRASFASYLSYKGVPLKEICELLGHTRVSTTDRFYTMTYPNYHKKIINITNEIGKSHIK